MHVHVHVHIHIYFPQVLPDVELDAGGLDSNMRDFLISEYTQMGSEVSRFEGAPSRTPVCVGEDTFRVEIGLGVSPVPAQMWQVVSLVPARMR